MRVLSSFLLSVVDAVVVVAAVCSHLFTCVASFFDSGGLVALARWDLLRWRDDLLRRLMIVVSCY